MKSILRRGTVVVALCFAALLALTGPASATAVGHAFWGVHTFREVPIPAGQLTAMVFGKGLNVEGFSMNWGSAGNLCNHHMSVSFQDRNGHQYLPAFDQKNQGNCPKGGSYTERWVSPLRVQPGRVCMSVYRDFGKERLATVCHGIY